jgi:mannose-6-phosphate isomerase-like protein (cupin superfamily)
MTKTVYADIPAYHTLDGSLIRELMHPRIHGNQAQSLAQATIPAGGRTLLHRHRASEELYHITSGAGRVWLADRWVDVSRGDTVCIPPGTPHCAEADGQAPLVILCCCSPAYAHADTDLLEDSIPEADATSDHRANP